MGVIPGGRPDVGEGVMDEFGEYPGAESDSRPIAGQRWSVTCRKATAVQKLGRVRFRQAVLGSI